MKACLVSVVFFCSSFRTLAQESDLDAAPLSLRIIAKRSEYVFTDTAKRAKSRRHATPVCLVVELTNRSEKKISVMGPPEPKLSLTNLGEDPDLGVLDHLFVAPQKTWDLDPGETVRMPLP